MSFEKFSLDSRLLAGIRRANFRAPTPIQAAAIPIVMNGDDVIGTAQTGTGKTAAFVLPILHRLLSRPRGRTRALIVTPTRELAMQIQEVIRELGTGTGIRSATIFGGVGPGPQIRALKDGVDILVACPGRLLDLLQQGYGRLDAVEILVIDEADRMFDMGFMPSVQDILKKLPVQRQTLLFSATFPREIENLAGRVTRNAQRVSVGLSRPAHTVAHALYPIQASSKTPFLLELLRQTQTDSVLVFTRTKHRAEKVSKQVARAGFRTTSLHGNRTQGQRQNAIDGFRRGTFQVLVATDIAARGLDIESISHVINYDMPDTADAYIHRIGRTGRAERSGEAFTLTTPEDREMVVALEKVMGATLPRKKLEGFDYSNPPPVPHIPDSTPRRSYAPQARNGSARWPQNRNAKPGDRKNSSGAKIGASKPKANNGGREGGYPSREANKQTPNRNDAGNRRVSSSNRATR